MRLLASRHLENFIAIFEAGNLHKASDIKGITQPALTKSLKRLEDEIGTHLFLRTSKGLEPTEAGNILYRHALKIDQELRIASLDIGQLIHPTQGEFRIGVGPGFAAAALPDLLPDFQRQFPGVKLTIQMGTTSQLVDELLENHLDVIATARPERELPEEYVDLHLFDSPMRVICRHDHPLHHEPDVGIRRLSDFNCVAFRDGREMLRQLKRTLGSDADRIQLAVETNSITVMLSLLEMTDYFSVVGEHVLPKAKREGILPLPITQSLWDMQVGLMCKRTLVDTRPIRAIRKAWGRHRRS